VIRGRLLAPTSLSSVVGGNLRERMGRRNLADVAIRFLDFIRGWWWRLGSVDHPVSFSTEGCNAGWSYADTRTREGAGREVSINSGGGRSGTGVWLQMVDPGSLPGSCWLRVFGEDCGTGEGEERRARAVIIT
jgi:hypothetical protein